MKIRPPRPMTGAQLRRTLARLNLYAKDLATLVDVHPNTVTHWLMGDRPVPGAIVAYVRELLKNR